MNDKNKTDPLAGCAIIIVLLALSPFQALYHGWVFWLLWNWFAAPMVPAITWHAAVGLMLLIGFLKMRPVQTDQGPQDALKQFLTVQISIMLFVGIAWAFHAIGFGVHP